MAIIRTLLTIYSIALVVDAILSYIPNMNKQPWRLKLKQVCDYSCDPIRKKLPEVLPLDVSPLIVILLIKIFEILW